MVRPLNFYNSGLVYISLMYVCLDVVVPSKYVVCILGYNPFFKLG